VTEQTRAPSGIDVSIPHAARIYDYLLGGKDNYTADRQAAEHFLAVAPDIRVAAQANRAFLNRVVRFLAEAGHRQFLDLGSGLPTQRNVHEVVQEVAPDARVVYVDHDPIAVAHSRALLSGTDHATVIQADVRRPEEILAHPELTQLINFDQPLALLLIGLLFLIGDEDDPAALVARFRDTIAPGSCMVVSHLTVDEQRPEAVRALVQAFERAAEPMVPRPGKEIRRFFEGFEVLPPGVVKISDWHPEIPSPIQTPATGWLLAGVGCKPTGD
jgi:hypothetical protein